MVALEITLKELICENFLWAVFSRAQTYSYLLEVDKTFLPPKASLFAVDVAPFSIGLLKGELRGRKDSSVFHGYFSILAFGFDCPLLKFIRAILIHIIKHF